MPASKKSWASASDRVWATILAGGVGSRFWPVSTADRPKQLLPLASDQPLIVDAVDRARALVPEERIRILAGEHLLSPFRSALEGLPESSYWVEPRARGTAPVLAWAAWRLARLDPDAVMISLHADHLIRPLQEFRDTVATAVELARRDGLLVTIGVTPDRIETGYGHLEPGNPLPDAGPGSAFRVRAFHEKPNAETAKRYIDEGYLWNTGIFVWKAATLLEEIEHHAPEISEYLPLLERSAVDFFAAVPISVIDRVVMERSDRVAVVAATFEWDDVGSWEALGRTRECDSAGNVILGPGRAVESERNIIFAEGGDVVLFGTHDLVVIRTKDTTVVLPRSRAADLKTLLAALEGIGQ